MKLPQVIIKKKRDGEVLSHDDIHWFLTEFDNGGIQPAQMSALLMAVFFKGLTRSELAIWTQVMLESGVKLQIESSHCVDKHSTGGVGDKTSFIIAPIVAALGGAIPMLSGRSLGHTGGTLDKLLAIPGVSIPDTNEKIEQLVHDHGLCFTGPTARIAPLDRKLYGLRDVTGTVENQDLIASSIMSKKLSEDISGLVMDMKFGVGAFMKSQEDALSLYEKMKDIGDAHGVKVLGVLSDMNQPLGRYFGLAPEIHEVLQILKGQEEPTDLYHLSVVLAALMVQAGSIESDYAKAESRVKEALRSGAAYQKFCDIIEAQGGDISSFEKDGFYTQASHKWDVCAETSGTVCGMDTEALGYLLVGLGGGRSRTDADIDNSVGVELHKKIGDSVEVGDPLMTCFVSEGSEVQEVLTGKFLACMDIRTSDAPNLPLIAKVM